MGEIGAALGQAAAIVFTAFALTGMLIIVIHWLGWMTGFLAAAWWRGATDGFAQGHRLMRWLNEE